MVTTAKVHDGDEVRLTMPARPTLLRVARLTAAGMASRIGLTFDEIEDVKIAVDELCFALVGSRGRQGDLALVYRVNRDGIEIEGRGPSDPTGRSEQTDLSRQILAAVVDEHELVADGDGLRFRLLKRPSSRG